MITPLAGSPTVTVTQPTGSTDALTTPTAVGATLADSAGLLGYRIDVYDSNSTVVASQSFSLAATHPTTFTLGDAANSLVLNPSQFANGQTYSVRVTATNIGNQSAASGLVGFVVDSGLKIGNLRMSFTDLSINVGGFPVTVTRTYDSLDSTRVGDFGYGWNLSYNTVRLVSTAQSQGNQALQGGDDIWISVGGGKREGFTFNVSGVVDPFYGDSIIDYSYTFQADDPHTTDTLGFVGVPATLYGSGLNNSGDLYISVDDALASNNAPFSLGLADGPGVGSYQLKTADGQTETIQYDTATRAAALTSVTDRLGNQLDYLPNSITAHAPHGEVLGTVTINRNDANLVTSITYDGETGSPISYRYDASAPDHLEYVDAAKASDTETQTTTYGYGAGGCRPTI